MLQSEHLLLVYSNLKFKNNDILSSQIAKKEIVQFLLQELGLIIKPE